MLKVRSCGVRRSVVLSSSARCGVSLRGLALCRTVLSCLVRHGKAMFRKALSWYGGVVSGPAGSSGARFGRLLRFVVRSGCAGRATVERGFAWLGKVLSGRAKSTRAVFSEAWCSRARQGELPSWQGGAVQSEVQSGKLSFWRCDVLRCGERFAKLLWGIVLRGEERHCKPRFGVLLFGMDRRSTVVSGFARLRTAGQALVLSAAVRLAAAGRGIVRFCRVHFCSVLLRSGMVDEGSVRRGAVSCSTVGRSSVLSRCCLVRSARAVQAGVKLCTVFQGNLRHYCGYVWSSEAGRCMVMLGDKDESNI